MAREFTPAVTKSNWPELQARGFEYRSHIGLPQSAALGPGDLEDEAYIAKLQKDHGGENVLIGDAWNSRTNLPDADMTALHHVCGVYINRRK